MRAKIKKWLNEKVNNELVYGAGIGITLISVRGALIYLFVLLYIDSKKTEP